MWETDYTYLYNNKSLKYYNDNDFLDNILELTNVNKENLLYPFKLLGAVYHLGCQLDLYIVE